MGFESSMIEAGVELMKDATCFVNVVEQAHGSAATIAKAHSYGQDTLLDRAAFHKIRALFCPDKEHLAMQRVQDKLCRLDARCPNKVTSRHMCFQQLAKEASVGHQGPKGELAPLMRDVMRNHSGHHAGLSVEEQRDFRARARWPII